MTPEFSAARQQQFLEVIDRDVAQQRFQAALRLEPWGEEQLPLTAAWGRVLSRDVVSAIDVPAFDRSNVDGFAVRAADTFGANEKDPRALELLDEVIASAVQPRSIVRPGQAISIATGGMVPRGADAIVMLEQTELEGERLLVRKAVASGAFISFAGTDMTRGETVLRQGEQLTSRQTGVLAAIGVDHVWVWRPPRVAIISTGDEIVPPGKPLATGHVYDSNQRMLADAVREIGGEPVPLGIVHDDLDQLRQAVRTGLDSAEMVLLSGGTSKGAGDLSYHVVSQLTEPGIVAHGVALKPGKPICLAAHLGKAVVVLPGFPTSAIFTFHEFVAPVIRSLCGLRQDVAPTVQAQMAIKVNSDPGRTEFNLVGLVRRAPDDVRGLDLAAYPMGQGSGSVTTFSRADGFVTIPRHVEIVNQGDIVEVTLLGRDLAVADLVVIGSHCVGLDHLLGKVQEAGFHTKSLSVGSTTGLRAAERGECDLAGIHLFDATTNTYNQPFIGDDLLLVTGYRRRQGILFRQDDQRFTGTALAEVMSNVVQAENCMMINRNQGSGTRILIDQLLHGSRPEGYAHQARNHHAVAAAIVQGRADWGVAIEIVARQTGLGFLPLTWEHFDFVVPRASMDRPAVKCFRTLLQSATEQSYLHDLGFVMEGES